MEQKYNLRSPAVKRLMREAQELHQPTEEFYAHPLEDNLFEWHFTVRGQPESDFDGGLYHGRIILPPEYPMKPPSIILLTPNGRFEVNKKICLSISGHHPESWQPCWSIRTALLAIIGFMPTPGKGAIGSLDYTPVERQILAKKSQNWKCKVCGHIKDCLMKRTESFSALNQEAKELAAQISFKSEVDSSEAAVKNGMAVPEKLNQSRNPVESSGETEKSSQRPMPNDVSLNSVIKTGSSTDNKDAECSPHSASSNSMSSPVQASSIKDINSSSNNPESITSENALRQRYQVSSSENTVLNKPNNESNPSTQCNSSTVIIFLIILVISGLLFRRIFLL